MIKVFKHASRRNVMNPVTGQLQEMVTVIFVESNRTGGANPTMSESTDALSRAVGQDVGLAQVRVHSHPVTADKLGLFPEGKEFPTLFINRRMYSFPQMAQQSNVDARMVDGKPTYFVSAISNKQEDDVDERISNDVLITQFPELFRNARVGATEVFSIEEVQGTAMGSNNPLVGQQLESSAVKQPE